MDWIEWIGYAGSALVAASLMMSAIVRLRLLNLAGALLFALYGALTGAMPVLLVNALIAVVNVVFLWRLARGRRDWFEVLHIPDPRNAYLRRFLEFHDEDIRAHFPDFDLDALETPVVVFILRDLMPAGLVVCAADGPDDLRVELDYVLPRFRDFKCARWFYRDWGPRMADLGFRRFTARTGAGVHRSYLLRMGFAPAPELGEGGFVRPVT